MLGVYVSGTGRGGCRKPALYPLLLEASSVPISQLGDLDFYLDFSVTRSITKGWPQWFDRELTALTTKDVLSRKHPRAACSMKMNMNWRASAVSYETFSLTNKRLRMALGAWWKHRKDHLIVESISQVAETHFLLLLLDVRVAADTALRLQQRAS
ncbi:hypothetical protein Prudu_016927 [Prunus dulcis]|uniref:Uncharacterized protein n=1 Tax=Prunus dulcis TaxID=3755 RepID=A0A4Y1RMT4_PRUDU|nr:hypothetical protein Prudu_016927 [Prunus dulcis]